MIFYDSDDPCGRVNVTLATKRSSSKAIAGSDPEGNCCRKCERRCHKIGHSSLSWSRPLGHSEKQSPDTCSSSNDLSCSHHGANPYSDPSATPLFREIGFRAGKDRMFLYGQRERGKSEVTFDCHKREYRVNKCC
jgi:hypothetical protein